MTAISPGWNARGLWLAASGANTTSFAWNGSYAGTTLYGTSGNDAMWTPGGGASIHGGAGDDRYFLYNMTDKAIEIAGQGIDTVWTYIPAYLLPAHVENLVIENDAASGTGNAQANILAGGTGSQTLNGGAGDDILSGGGGADRFVVQGGTGWDVITDFQNGVDSLAIGGAFTQFTGFEAVQAAMRQVGTDVVMTLSETDAVIFRGKVPGAFTAADFMLPQASLAGSLRLTFSDEFTGFTGTPTGLDASGRATWRTTYMWGDRTLPANKEAEYYTDATVGTNPFSVDPTGTGTLTITAAPAAGLPNGLTYSSGVITSECTAVQTYGYFEVRAKIPAGAGFWPAFWLLRADGDWPPEIDVMEILGNAPGRLHMTAHSDASGSHTQESAAYWTTDLSLDYHTYAVSWRPDRITWYLDGTALFSTATPDDMHGPMYMIANLAVGGTGSWPGPADGVSSGSFVIDYIRAYQFEDLAGPYRPPVLQARLVTGSGSVEGLVGTSGDDRIEGRGGNDRLRGNGGADVFVFGTADGQDVILDFRPGDDRILVLGQASVSIGTSSAGVVVTFGSGGTVTLDGVTSLQPGDILHGDQPISGTAGVIDRSASALVQTVSASGGADTILGGMGDDLIQGGQGADVLTGGGGRDSFVFGAWDGRDRITDFVSGTDRILLQGIPAETVWVNPARDRDGVSGLEIDYATGQSIFLPGLTGLAAGDIVFLA